MRKLWVWKHFGYIILDSYYAICKFGKLRSGHAAATAKSLQSCPTLRPHRRQPSRFCHPWDSLGKNTGVDCHFLLQCMKAQSESEVVHSCPTLSDPMDCSLPSFSVMGFSKPEYIINIFVYIYMHSRYQFISVAPSCPTPCNPMNRSMPGPSPTPKVHLKSCPLSRWWPSNHLILCRPLLLLPPIPPSIRGFSNESALHIRWPKYWSFIFNISPSNEHPGLISFRMDWLDLLAVQGTPKSLLQHHSSKASILRHSAFFIVQLSHPYMTTGKTIALTRHGPLLAK